MNSIPLIKGNTPQEINTSIIALKKALDNLQATSSEDLQKRIDEINAQIETLNQQITDLQPIDSITSGNMHAVTSNAVANSNVMPVDAVTSGNMHSVTSNAVAAAITGNTPYNSFFNNSDFSYNIDTIGASHRSYWSSSAGGNTTGNCPSEYGVVETIVGNDGAWKFQVAKEAYSDITYTRQNINDGGWTAWQPVLSGTWETLWSSGYSIIKGIVCNGKAFVTIHLQGFECSLNGQVITTVAEKYRPRTVSRGFCFAAENPLLVSYINIEANGNVNINGMNGKTVYGDSFIMIEKDV